MIKIKFGAMLSIQVEHCDVISKEHSGNQGNLPLFSKHFNVGMSQMFVNRLSSDLA